MLLTLLECTLFLLAPFLFLSYIFLLINQLAILKNLLVLDILDILDLFHFLFMILKQQNLLDLIIYLNDLLRCRILYLLVTLEIVDFWTHYFIFIIAHFLHILFILLCFVKLFFNIVFLQNVAHLFELLLKYIRFRFVNLQIIYWFPISDQIQFVLLYSPKLALISNLMTLLLFLYLVHEIIYIRLFFFQRVKSVYKLLLLQISQFFIIVCFLHHLSFGTIEHIFIKFYFFAFFPELVLHLFEFLKWLHLHHYYL